MKIKLLLIFILSFVLAVFPAHESMASKRQNTPYLHVFGAFGPVLGFGSLRAGGKNFEVGVLSNGMIGACGLFQLSSPLYSAFGGGINAKGLGLYAGLGAEFWSFWIMDIRFELSATSTIGNDTEGAALLGANFNF